MAPSKRFHFWKGKARDSKAEVDKTRAHLEQQPFAPSHPDTLGENSQEQSTEDVKGKSSLEDDPTRFGLKVLVGQPRGESDASILSPSMA
jgi:hypothetical protein